MKVIIAPDKFKGSLTSFEVCNAIAAGIKRSGKNIDTLNFPMADGGDGFASVMQYYLDTKTIECSTTDPLGRTIAASYQWNESTGTAIIEMATASGLVLLKQEERNPLKTSSYGTGILIKDAVVNRGARKIVLGVGGSATNDGGMGILAALGFQFTDAAGNLLQGVGENLVLVDTIIPPATKPGINFEIACDVQNVLYDKHGAAFTYAPQKGASAGEVQLLDEGLKNFAAILKQQTGIDIATVPGTGAAGGVAAGLLSFFNTAIKSGIGMIIAASNIKSKIAGADLLITGEGKIDQQTLQGKVVSSLAQLAQQNQIPAIAFCGILEASDSLLKKLQLQSVECISSPVISAAESMANAKQLLADKAAKYFKLYPTGNIKET